MSQPLILIIEDEASLRRFLVPTLANQDYQVLTAATGTDGLTMARSHNPDLVLLDLGLPDIDGLEVTRRLREWSRVPVIVLSARGQERDKVAALDLGADDYVTKPFAVGELLARMRVALRHQAGGADAAQDPVFEAGGLRVDRVRRVVTVDGQEVRLTPIEYRLLAALCEYPGRVLTHEHLLKRVWGPGYASQHHYLRVYMAQLRQKLEREPSRPRFLLTELGVGYRLRDD